LTGYRRFQFEKHSQLFIRTRNVTLSIAAMVVSQPWILTGEQSGLQIHSPNSNRLS
jgi:hypothetical protein